MISINAKLFALNLSLLYKVTPPMFVARVVRITSGIPKLVSDFILPTVK